MNINTIKSEKVRSIISGSPTPAQDIVGLIGADELTQWEKNEALEYFSARGGLQSVATAERNFCFYNDI